MSRTPGRRTSRRTHLRQLLSASAAGVIVLGLLTGNVAAATGPGLAGRGAAEVNRRGAGAYTVTLITGDVVHVTDLGGGKFATDVQRPTGARGGVRAETIGQDLYVIPDEAMPYLAADTVDRRLFDVTTLIEAGYDDQHSDGIPLIVGYGTGPTPMAASAAAPAPTGTTRVRALPSINATAVRATKKHARQVWNGVAPAAAPAPTARAAKPALGQGLAKIWLDGRVHATMAQSAAQIGAPAAWAAGFDGKGVKVAVLDTGADQSHPDLAGRVSLAVSFVPGESTSDGNGHGTHTLSTIGGSGAASGGAERGIAPGATLIVGKVLADGGYGDDSWVIAGMEWAAAQGADVISMSLGGSTPSDGTDPMSLALDRLTADTGALFVVAAGNTGSEAGLSAPGAADAALTVGAIDADDQLAYFSTTGPRFGDYALKPDLVAPGVDILAAKAGGTADTGYYETMSGTSMATPHVAGAAAILAQEHPGWGPQELKDALMSTTKPLPDYTAYQVGAGRVDLAASVPATLTATGSVYFGLASWPHQNVPTVSRAVTYTNTGATAVTLRLTETAMVVGGPYDLDPQADAGQSAPAGMFGLSAGTVTVPAHGTASVTATANPSLGAAGRRYLGQIAATNPAGTVVARTQVGLYTEDERHNLDVTLKDRAGAPVAGYLELQLFGSVGDPIIVPVDESGHISVRMLAGAYSAFTYIDVAGSHGADSAGVALLGDPEIVLDRDRTLVLDARQAKEATAKVALPTEDRALYLDWYRSDGKDSVLGVQYQLSGLSDSMFVLPTKKVSRGSFEYESRWRKAVPLLTLTNDGTPVPAVVQAGSSFYNGGGRLRAVAVGAGTPAEYAGANVRGAAVLVRRSDAITAEARAQAAAAAGAALLLVVNDGPGKLMEWVGTDEGAYSGVPVATLTATVGNPLIAAARTGRLNLGVIGVPNSPYVYDLADPHPDAVPTDLTYRPRPADLATVDMRFHGTKSYASGEFRWDYRPYRTYAFGFLQRMDMPGTRIDFVSAQPGTAWAETAVTGPGMALVSSSDIHAYPAGAITTVDWFGPVVRPRDGAGFWSSTRYDGFIAFNVQPWADGGVGHAGYLVEGDTLKFDVYADGKLLKTSAWASASLEDVPARTIRYTLDLTTSRDPSVYPLSPRTHTVWRVVSKPVKNAESVDLMPVLQLDYQVDTDLAGAAPGGDQRVGVAPSHLPGAVGAGRIAGATMSVSFDDGATWREARLTKAATGGWTAAFTAPKTGYVSLRTTAWDDAGNMITQEVTRAYGLTALRGSWPQH